MSTTSKIPGEIIQTASRLFAADGFQVGIDRIISEAKIAKMSLYKFFPSKDLLVSAVIKNAHERLMAELLDLTQNSTSEQDKLMTVFLSACKLSRTPEVRSGLITQALYQFPSENHFAHSLAAELRMEVSLLLEQLITAAYPKLSAERCAQGLQMLIEGYMASVSIFGEDVALECAAQGFASLIRK